MRYGQIEEGRFISRPNRFIANVCVQGNTTRAHVKNTGRLNELLVRDAVVYLQRHDNANRSTGFSLIGVRKGDQVVNIDSTAPNKVMLEWLSSGGLTSVGNRTFARADGMSASARSGDIPAFADSDTIRTGDAYASEKDTIIGPTEKIVSIKPEFTYGESRIDFLIGTSSKLILMEVKGVTLEENGIALFPDAPTERGVKHILELCRSLKDGYFPVIAFVIKMGGISHFSPNAKTHREFSDALIYAHNLGVRIIALDCEVSRDSITIRNQIDVVL